MQHIVAISRDLSHYNVGEVSSTAQLIYVQHMFYIHQLVLCIQNRTSQSETETSLEIYVSHVVIHKYIIILSSYFSKVNMCFIVMLFGFITLTAKYRWKDMAIIIIVCLCVSICMCVCVFVCLEKL